MSLSDHEARAMAVKMIPDSALRALHLVEEKEGRYLLPWEIAQRFTKAVSIKKHWGIPENSIYQANHVERIKAEITTLVRNKKCSVNLAETESRANFDWHVFHSDIDFSYHAAKRSAADSFQTATDVFGEA